MKICKVIILDIVLIPVMLFAFTFSVKAYDNENDKIFKNGSAELFESLDNDSIELLYSLGFDDFSTDELINLSFADILSTLIDVFVENLFFPAKNICIIFVVLIINFIAESLLGDNGKMKQYFEFITVLFVSFISFSVVSNIISETVKIIHILCGLMKMLIPILTAVVSISGNPALATGSSALSLYISELIILVCDEFLAPMLTVLASLSVFGSINISFRSVYIIEFVRKLFNYVLGLIAAVYSGVLTIRDIVCASLDKISGNSFRFILGSSVPVVGGTLSEGLSAVISSVTLFKTTFGISGIIVISVVSVPVLFMLTGCYLTFYVCEFISSLFGSDRICSVFSSFRYVVSMLSSLILFVLFVFLISVSTVIILGKN